MSVRKQCQQCTRPLSVCLCPFISKQDNTLPVLILRHKDEATKALGTAKLVVSGLRRCQLLSAESFAQKSTTDAMSKLGIARPILLYKKSAGEYSQHCRQQQEWDLALKQVENSAASLPFGCDGLLVLDGTWRNTRELMLNSSWLATLPSLSLKAGQASRYRIRKSNQENSLATIEAIAEILSLVDRHFDAQRLLRPFEEMINFQISKMGLSRYQADHLNASDF